MDTQVQEFFAVSSASLYRVSVDRDDEYGWPTVVKLAAREGVDSGISVGVGLKNGRLVGVMASGICLYDSMGRGDEPERPQRPEQVNTRWWGGYTSPIAALFLRLEDAEECLRQDGLETLDPRWRDQTQEVLSAIGNDHPVFIISRMSHGTCFPADMLPA